jgi:hypothetical protein
MNATTRWLVGLPLLLGLTLAFGGCDKLGLGKKKGGGSEEGDSEVAGSGAQAKAPLKKAPTPELKEGDKLKLGQAEGVFLITEKLGLSVSFHPTPKGTRLTSGTLEDVTTMEGSQARVEVDVGEALGKLSPEVAFDYQTKWKSGVKVVVALAGYEPVEIEAPALSPAYGLGRALEGVKNRGVSFGKEPDAPPPAHSIAYLGGLTPKVFGPAKTLVEVDWVAIPENLPGRPGKTCDGYKDNKGGPPKSLVLERIDREVVLYERKTAKELGRKKFEASEECPMLAMGDKASTYPADGPIESWLRGERNKK